MASVVAIGLTLALLVGLAPAAAADTVPTVTQQPVDSFVLAGQTATFSLAATGGPVVRWQSWVPGADQFTDIPGATASTYTTGILSAADDGTRYRAVLTNAFGAATTEIVTLSVGAPVVTQQPQGATVGPGSTVTFSLAATGGPVVRWQSWVPGADRFTDIPGATASTYTTGILSAADDGTRYRAVLTNALGAATTEIATLSVGAPAVTQQPEGITVGSGATATFTAAASRWVAVRWQSWAPGADHFTDIPGATAASYTTGNLTTADSGTRFRAIFTDAGGAGVTIDVPLTVTGVAPVVTGQPVPVTVESGRSASFTAAASGDPTPTVQWQKADPGSDTFTDIPGATGSTYTTGVLTSAATGGRYRAVFANPGASVPSDSAQLTVHGIPSVTRQPDSVNTWPGQAVWFTAAASGDPTPTVQWQRAAPGSNIFTDIPGAIGTTYTTGVLTTADNSSRYRAVFTNASGSATSNPATALVSVGSPTITAPNAAVNQPYFFTIPITGTATPIVTAGSLPPGLTMSADGTITGTPTKTGLTAIPISSNGIPAIATLTINIQQGTTMTGTAPDGRTDAFYDWAPTTTGSPTLTVTSGTLPSGVQLTNNRLTGKPSTPGIYTFTLQAANGFGAPVTLSSTVTIRQTPTITGTPTNGTPGIPYTYTFTTTGYPTPTITRTTGTLPPGLTLQPDGTIAGTPTTRGVYTFKVQADNGATPTTQQATIRIN